MAKSTSAKSAKARSAPVRYVALGDSYAAGIGGGRPTPTSSDCSGAPRSANAYPKRVADGLRAQLKFVAVCGATTSTVRSQQLGALDKSTTLVTVQAGGNDAGFAGVLESCITGSDASCNAAVTRGKNVVRTELPRRLDQLYGEIRKKAPKAKVVVVGYPHLFKPGLCGNPLKTGRMSDGEINKINQATDELAATLSSAARKHGFSYVDPRASFKSHAVCSGEEWIHAISKPRVESFHPTPKGHEALGWLVWQVVKP